MMRVFLEKMMLDLPGVVVAELVGQLDLDQRVLEELVFRMFRPGSGELVLVEDSEFHAAIVRLLNWILGREPALIRTRLNAGEQF